jgi:hypothetical protein
MLFRYRGEKADVYVNSEGIALVEVYSEDNLVIHYTGGMAVHYADRLIGHQLTGDLLRNDSFVQLGRRFVNFRNCPRIIVERKPDLRVRVCLSAVHESIFSGEDARMLAEKIEHS